MTSSSEATIMIVDDNHQNLRLLSGILSNRGYRVRIAPGGTMALKSIEKSLPDLILLDIMMPDIDGYTVCKQLKADEKTSDIPIIFISALNEVFDKVQAFSVGGIDYITKPFEIEEVLVRVKTHVTFRIMQKQQQQQNEYLQKQITERQRAETALREAHDVLEQRVQERTSELLQVNKKLQRLTRQMTMIQEEERRRLSRELHDEANQSLTAIMITLQLMQDDMSNFNETIHQRLNEALHMTSSTMDRLRSLAHNLRPPALDTLGLETVIEEMCSIFGQRTDIYINVVTTKLPKLTNETRICFYRFVQEALSNIVKHSQASHVWVTLNHDEESVSITVEDNGQGVDLNMLLYGTKQLQGIGLLGMQERLESLNGVLEMDSAVGQGLRIVASIAWENAVEQE